MAAEGAPREKLARLRPAIRRDVRELRARLETLRRKMQDEWRDVGRTGEQVWAILSRLRK